VRLCALAIGNSIECSRSFVRRTIWDGQQELAEIQAPDNATDREVDTGYYSAQALINGKDPNPYYGRVIHTYGHAIDQPLTRDRSITYFGRAAGSPTARPLSRCLHTRDARSMTEILFVVEEAPEGGYIARSVAASIFAEADDLPQLREAVRDAVRCHFEEASRPKVMRLHLVHDEVIAA
jgi:hypothetical protein